MALIGGNKATAAPVKATAPTAAPKAPTSAPTAAPKAEKRVRKPLELDLGGLVVKTVTDPQEMAKKRRVRERSPEQKRLDAMVEAAWQAWKDKGQPTEWPKMPGVSVTIPEAKHETLLAGIRKAGQFYDLRVRFGRPIKDGSGNVEVVFVVTDKLSNDDDDDESED
jgi:hypothetical protein